jgi:hypothetical protein
VKIYSSIGFLALWLLLVLANEIKGKEVLVFIALIISFRVT